ncbi:hypothetical protein DFH06DRAFT_1370048 [Mycena polygramma]|nr:hypothetical protein DFH06DRAFT_1370048 [Mycena polygramma]
MTTVPQELIDEILYHVDDTEGLKACALVGSNFRDPSQRILLHSHTLDPWRGDRNRTSDFLALLVKSPQIAAYITRLIFRVRFSSDAIPATLQDLQGILARLRNVRHCTIVGGSWRKSWDDTTRISALIFEFLHRQPLEQLHIRVLASLALSVFTLLLSASPTVAFYCVLVSVRTKDLPMCGPPTGSVLTQLLLDETTETICAVLSRPAFAPYLTAVRKLKISPKMRDDGGILSSVVRTLEHLCVDCTLLILAGIFLDLPRLAVLRVIELTMPAYKDSARWLVDTLFPALLSAQTPALEEIRITYPLGLQQFVIPAETLHAVDALMGGFPQLPRLCWHVGFDRADAAALIQQGMPMMHRLGKVFVRGYSD